MAETKIVIRATDKTKAAMKSVQASMSKLTSQVFSLKGAIGAAIGVGGMGALVSSSLEAADALAKKSDQLGVTTQKLAGLHHATQLYTSAGVGALDEALVKATKRLGEFNATGGGAAAKWLEKLNLDTQQLAQLSPDQLFLRYAEAIRGLNDRGQQLAATSALMGDESRQLIGLVDAGGEAIAEATAKAEAYGIALNRVDAAKIEAANDALFEAGQAVRGVAMTLTVQLAPYLKVIAERFANAAAESGGFKTQVLDAVEKSAMGIAYLGDLIAGLEFAWAAAKLAAAKAGEYIIKTIVVMAEQQIKILSRLPGKVGEFFSETQAVMDATVQAAEARSARLKVELDQIAMAGLPSDGLQEEMAKIRAIAEETGLAVAQAAASNVAPAGGGEDATTTAALDKQREMLAKKLQNLDQYLLSAQERERIAYENRQFIIEDAFQNELIGAQRRQLLLEQLESQHQQKLAQIEYQGLTAREKFAVAFAKRDVRNALAAGAQMTAGVATQNKTLFEVNKALALANAAVALPDAVLQSFQKGGGYPWGLVPAGLMLATGLAQINAIRSATFGGAGGAPSLAGAGGGGAATVNTAPAGSGLAGGLGGLPDVSRETAGPQVTVVIEGNAYGWDDDMREKVVETFREAVDLGYKI